MSVQFIEQHGKKQFAVIPFDIYSELLEKAEMLDDIKAYDEAMASNDEMIPSEVVNRLFSGESKVKVWREFRGLSQAALAEVANLSQANIAQIEGGKRTGSIASLKRIAEALTLDLDDLV
jgi:DNA-binding XRE family transcriptional regulator